MEEEDTGNLQDTLLSFFACPTPYGAKMMEPFMSLEETLREEATLEVS